MFGDPEGGHAKTKLSHYGIGAWCCYKSVDFRLGCNGSDSYTFYVFGNLEGKDEYMENHTEVFMTREQVLELIKYLEKRMNR